MLQALLKPPLGAQSNEVLASTDSPLCIERVTAIAKTYPPGIQGQGGNNQLYKVAALACRDFALSPETATAILWEHLNSRCIPPERDYARFCGTVSNAANFGRNAIGEKSPERFLEGVHHVEPKQSEKAGQASVSGFDPRFKFLHIDDIEPVLDDLYLIEGLMPASGLMIVYGAPRCGKSFLVSHATLCVAAGIEYAGRRTERAHVIYIVAEGGRPFRNRIRAARKRLGITRGQVSFNIIVGRTSP